MATLKQSIQIHNGRMVATPKSITAAIIWVVKKFDVVRKTIERLRKDDGVKKDSRGSKGNSDISSVTKVLEGMDEKLKSINTSINNIEGYAKARDDVLKEKKKKEKDAKAIHKKIGRGIAAVAGATIVFGNFLKATTGLSRQFLENPIFEKLHPSTDSGNPENQGNSADTAVNMTSSTTEEKQVQLETALNNLKAGIDEWRIANSPTADAKKEKLNDRLNALAIGVKEWQKNQKIVMNDDRQTGLNNRLDALATGIGEWRASRVVPTIVDQQKKLNTRLDSLATGINTWQTNRSESKRDSRQTGLNNRLDALATGIGEWRKTRTVPTAADKQEKLNARLNALASGIEEWRSSPKDNKEGMSRSDMLVKEFKDTITEMTSFLEKAFVDPVKAVEKQFLHMGVVSIYILRQMEAAIANVASALGSLQSTASNAQAIVTEANKQLQTIPNAEQSVSVLKAVESSVPSTSAVSTQNGVSMQQSADAYEISSQKAGEITAMSGNQAGSRQTIINMNSNMPVNASITNGMDMETFLRQLGIGVDMAMRSAAEGVPL